MLRTLVVVARRDPSWPLCQRHPRSTRQGLSCRTRPASFLEIHRVGCIAELHAIGDDRWLCLCHLERRPSPTVSPPLKRSGRFLLACTQLRAALGPARSCRRTASGRRLRWDRNARSWPRCRAPARRRLRAPLVLRRRRWARRPPHPSPVARLDVSAVPARSRCHGSEIVRRVPTISTAAACCADAQHQDVAVVHHGTCALVFAQPDLAPGQRCGGHRIARGHFGHGLRWRAWRCRWCLRVRGCSGDRQQRGQQDSDQKGAHATSVSRAGRYRRSAQLSAAIDAAAAVTAMPTLRVLCVAMRCAYLLLAHAASQLPDDNSPRPVASFNSAEAGTQRRAGKLASTPSSARCVVKPALARRLLTSLGTSRPLVSLLGAPV